jgi:2-keto-4-pentenoate hydratase/2-oxohepta-3-ene-1,7-dioic acid hydratase in catechol pathway
VFAIALNYAPHAAEAGFVPPEAPLVFTKFPTCITGPQSTVRLPAGKVDWEIEVVAVIGRGGHRIPRPRAWDAVAGLTCGQDLSERRDADARDAAAVLARQIAPRVRPDRASRGDAGRVRRPVRRHVPGDADRRGRRQPGGADRNHRGLIFPIDDLVARLSEVCTLLPGDLVFTGTPAGVGNGARRPRYLQPGETLVSRLDGVGEIRQTFA